MRKSALLVVTLLSLTACGGFFGPRDNSGSGGTGSTGTPKFVYAANLSGGVGVGTISGFTVNTSSGALTALSTGPFNAGTGPDGIGSDSAGKFVYVSNQGGGVSAYTVDRTAGTLTGLNNLTPYTAGTSPVSVAVDPSARYVYVANRGSKDISGYTVASTGQLTAFAATFPTSAAPFQVRIDPSGRFVYAALGSAGVQVFKINSDGTLTSVRTVAPSPCVGANDVGIDPNTRFAYVPDGSTGVCAYAINASTGDLTLINQAIIPTANTPIALAVSPNAKFLYVVNKGSNSVSGFAINSDGTLTATSGSPFTTGAVPVAVAIDPSSSFVYVTNLNDNTISIYTINSSGGLSSNGTATAIQGPDSIVVTK
jgi:6-phosphogluconolactonase (cycloisomerase 2 family)